MNESHALLGDWKVSVKERVAGCMLRFYSARIGSITPRSYVIFVCDDFISGESKLSLIASGESGIIDGLVLYEKNFGQDSEEQIKVLRKLMESDNPARTALDMKDLESPAEYCQVCGRDEWQGGYILREETYGLAVCEGCDLGVPLELRDREDEVGASQAIREYAVSGMFRHSRC